MDNIIRPPAVQAVRLPLLEVIAVSPWECGLLSDLPVQRIELVSALEIGGLSPSHTIVRKALEASSLPVQVMVRHRDGQFIYSSDELDDMLTEVTALKQLMGPKVNHHGVVVGALEASKNLNTIFIKEVVREFGRNVTLHKACEHSNCLKQTIRQAALVGVERVLTQGGITPIMDNLSILTDLKSQSPIPILVGGGITHSNIGHILTQVQPSEVHVGTAVRGPSKYDRIDSSKVVSLIQSIEASISTLR